MEISQADSFEALPREGWEQDMRCVEFVEKGLITQEIHDKYFFPEKKDNQPNIYNAARTICQACDVQPDCLYDELESSERISKIRYLERGNPDKSQITSDVQVGMFGGASPNERKRILEKYKHNLQSVLEDIDNVVADLNAGKYRKH